MKTLSILKPRNILLISVFFYLLLSHDITYSSESSGSMSISAVVNASCVVKTSALQFGSYDPIDSNSANHLSAASNIELRCVRGTNAVIKIDSGTNQHQTPGTSRAMVSADGRSYLGYELYQDQGGQQIWDQQNTVSYYSHSSAPANLKVYANIPANQPVPDGIYSDVVKITVTY